MNAPSLIEPSERPALTLRVLGLADYEPTWKAMQAFNAERDADTEDEIWLVEHPPVFTLGLAADESHVLAPGNIPVVRIDRGGQVTYHGPGQLVCYLMLDLRRLGYGVKALVRRIEDSVVDLLGEYSIAAHAEPGMPGVYVGEGNTLAKISAVGLRVSRHCTFHGLSLNVDMDLEPFSRINPCGYERLKAAQLKDFGVSDKISVVGQKLVLKLNKHLF